jgi:hypothetical protein
MPRFISHKDFNFFQHINKEVIEDLVDVEVIIYKIHIESSKSNIYGESTDKSRYSGTKIHALVKYDPKKSVADEFGVGATQEVEFRFLRKMLQEVNIYPEEGDIVGFNGLFYEIDTSNDVELVGGQPFFSNSIICRAHLTRKSGIQLEERQV